MITVVKRWTGAEVRALRRARRMSIIEFAAHLGVSDRMVSKWEAGGAKICPRPVNQAALDTSLARLDGDGRSRFTEFVSPDVLSEARDTDVTELPVPVRHPVDGKLMTWVPSGIYLSGLSDEPIWMDGFYIDVFPTTNIDYARFVAASGHRTPQHWTSDRCPQELADHPVVWVDWEDAQGYAQWAGKALPSSRQWEKAARGTRGSAYPWGNQPTPAKCNVRGSGPGITTPVDRYKSGVSPFGVYDMCGNVWEWLATPTMVGRHELKGSAFTSLFDRAVPAAFNDADDAMLDDDTGFRCVTVALGE
ncbi:SUMF1/EgtB/PvdO family nonheme iron enzyme [Nocardia terpenica]|nr:SUMF1/EgtB/PvdO family nonheme iron enzyme [Nocardia terpenica]MBF6107682.1 SUMF1/EgtB/PvdO family nonheme iron enzyme [Nocardia terpenica]MBF6114750.1 SUMF1/EgtB/PvdO family nonheme iron enzyme [Nocardia terpenica]MBF6121263.1 SUMF1/EgtB/PvdO family nonheme iron enzyme [Nocardia terpenica]MBF6153195.1 SUMF1/EgtB/PvdO family nonheme iron enzyme [Nocardia terpenica]